MAETTPTIRNMSVFNYRSDPAPIRPGRHHMAKICASPNLWGRFSAPPAKGLVDVLYLCANIACRADSLRAYPNRTNCIMV